MRLRRLLTPLLGAALLLSGCAASRRAAAEDEAFLRGGAPVAQKEGCRPFFISPMNDASEAVPNHSCWHRLWEVPAAIVIVPAAVVLIVGAGTAPIWVPILLAK